MRSQAAGLAFAMISAMMLTSRWFDADSIIVNPSIPWHVFLPPRDFNDKHIIGTRDDNGFNAGLLIFHVHPWTVDALIQALAVPLMKPDVDLSYQDQSALGWVLDHVGYEEHFIYQPRRWWNRYPHDADGDRVGTMCLHFPGLDDVKLQLMTRHLDHAEDDPENKLREFVDTEYGQEIQEYWNLLRYSRHLLDQANRYKTSLAAKPALMAEKVPAVDEALMQLIRLVLKETGSLRKIDAANRNLESLLPSE